MAECIHKLSMKPVMLTVRLPRALPLRLWIGTRLIMLAALVIGCGIQIDTKER